MITSGMMSSNTPEWATPSDFFAELNKEFRFNLDPCSTHENAKCDKHFTKEDDGLAQNWGGTEYFAIPHTEGSCQNGSRNAMRKAVVLRWLSCLSRQERTQDGFTTTFTARQR